MSQSELVLRFGQPVPIDVIRTSTGGLKVITNYDIELFKLGLTSDPYDC